MSKINGTPKNADKSLQYNYGLKNFGSQDRKAVITLSKLSFSDISFSAYSKPQMLMLSEHQLRGHPLSTYAKFSEELTFLTRNISNTYVCV